MNVLIFLCGLGLGFGAAAGVAYLSKLNGPTTVVIDSEVMEKINRHSEASEEDWEAYIDSALAEYINAAKLRGEVIDYEKLKKFILSIW